MSPSTYTPFPGISSVDEEENQWWLNREVSLIQNLLRDEGRGTAHAPDGTSGRFTREGTGDDAGRRPPVSPSGGER